MRPHELLCDYLGPQTNPYNGERYELLPAHMDELRALAVPVTAPERLWILQQQEDEVLDYRKALDEYRFARLSLECGGKPRLHRLRALPRPDRPLPRALAMQLPLAAFLEQVLATAQAGLTYRKIPSI